MSNLAIFNKTIQLPQTQAYLNEVLKDKKDSFVTSLVSVVANNAMLQACEPVTIIYAAMKATALDLPFDNNLGFAYVIPYKDNSKGVSVAQFQMGVRGFLQLAMRTGQFANINVDRVYEGEISKKDKLSGDIELNGEKKSDKVVGYYAYMKLLNGFAKTLFMTAEEVKAHGKRFSKSFTSGPWDTDFDAMAKKTVLKALLSKYAPMSVNMQSVQQAIKADQAIYRDETMTEDYADNQAQEELAAKNAQVEKVKAHADKIRERARAAAQPAKQQPVEAKVVNPTNEDFAEEADDDLPASDEELFNQQ